MTLDAPGPEVRGRTAADLLATIWGVVYATWAGLKFLAGSTPAMCLRPPIAELATLMSFFELILGIAVASRPSRRIAALVGIGLHVGLVLWAFIAHARHLPWKGCGCVFVGIEFPWLPGHALLAAALLLPFLAIFVREERRHRRVRSAG